MMGGNLHALVLAFYQLVDPWSLFLLIVGTVLGLVIGILPGLGPPIAIAIALPFTFYMAPVPSLILLLAIYSAATYGGSITAIALGIPGTGAAIATVADGHRMFKQGRGGEALGYSLIGSVIGGLFSTIVLALCAPLLADIAMSFGPREYLAISVFGLAVVVRVAGSSLFRGIFAGAIGIFLTTWGIDPVNGTTRYLFGSYNLYEGIPFVPFLVGLFAISEMLLLAEKRVAPVHFDKGSLSAKLPSLSALSKMKALLFRSAVVGTLIGLIPGEGAAVGAFFAYSEARRNSRTPERFGTGIPEGVLAPETANNATIGGALVPTLTLGVPGSPAAAVLLGAFLIQGLVPGPKLFSERPDLMYAIFAGLFVINILMLFLGLLAIKFAARIVAIPANIIVPSVLILCFVGAYSTANNMFGVWVTIWAGLFGYIIRKLGFPLAPLSIGFVLGPMIELSLRQSILISDGSVITFFSSTVAGVIYFLLVINLLWGPVRKWIGSRSAQQNAGGTP